MKNLLYVLICGVAVVLAGCASQFHRSLSDVHEPLAPVIDSPEIDTLFVVPTQDHRTQEGKTKFFRGLAAFIPFVRSGYQQGNPDRYLAPPGRFSHDFADDVTDTVINDVKASNIARRVVKLDDQNNVPELTTSDRLLRIELHEAVWRRNFRLYGMSIYGVLAWLVAPVSDGEVDLELLVQLENSNGNVIASDVLSSTQPVTEWIYKGPPRFEPYNAAYGEISPRLRELTMTRSLPRIERVGYDEVPESTHRPSAGQVAERTDD